MDKKVINLIIKNKDFFVPIIFTEKQIEIIQKRVDSKKLTNSDYNQWYLSIKPKLRAMMSIRTENKIFINSAKIIKKRLEIAFNIFEELRGEKAFLSGSFLFSNRFKDIDVFIISKRKRKEIKEGKIHYIFISKNALKTPLIQSASRSSISNFIIPKEYESPKMSIFDYMNLFQETALLIIKKKDAAKDVRDIFFHYLYIKNESLPASEELFFQTEKFFRLTKEKKLKRLRKMIKEILKKYKKTYLKKELVSYNKVLKEDILSFKKNSHLKYYLNTYQEALIA
ncbi:hypothetical protein GOV08_02550 [Candidatus Woesearchaeota archaeon]|nr:hypothetical protein [Candidatus Woesearchaeota archaeon]